MTVPQSQALQTLMQMIQFLVGLWREHHLLQGLEHDGVFIESLGQSVRGTVSMVVADNLAAHS